MSITFKFKSLDNPNNTMYVFHESPHDLWDRYATHIVSSYLAYYETLGDGAVQHTPESLVCEDKLVDVLASLADYLLTASDEELHAVRYLIPAPPRHQDIEFARKLKHNPDKPAYYNVSERKVSRSASKRHDKRWELVPEWADGELAAVRRILLADSFGRILWDYSQATAIADYYSEIGEGYYNVAVAIGLTDKYSDPRYDRLAGVYSTLRSIIHAHQLRTRASEMIEYYKKRLVEEEARTEAETAAA